MGGKIGAVAKALGGAVAWGAVLAWWFDASLMRGVLVGLWTWAPAIVFSVQWREAPADDTPFSALGL